MLVMNQSIVLCQLMQWLREDFMKYLQDWQQEVNALPVKKKERQKFCLSRETMDGMKITGKFQIRHALNFTRMWLFLVNSFCELGPKLQELSIC